MQLSGIAVFSKRTTSLLSDKTYVPVKKHFFAWMYSLKVFKNKDFGNASETTLAS